MEDNSFDHQARINRIKKIIIFVISFLFLLLLISCIVLTINCIDSRKKISELQNELSYYVSDASQYDDASGVYSVGDLTVASSDQHIDGTLDNTAEVTRKVYLTFDDGPSSNTDALLDVLKKYDVKATFFVVGNDKEKYAEQYKRIVDEGHTLGMHSYSHKYDQVYESVEAFENDLTTLQEYLYETTGVWSRIYRFPGGSSNTVSAIPITDFIEYLNEQGIRYFDWNIVSGDVADSDVSKETIISNCLRSIEKYDECVILMHDLTERKSTVDALDTIIESILKMDNTVILPITDETVPVQHVPAQISK